MNADRPRLLGAHEVTVPHGPRLIRVGRMDYTIPTSAGVANGPSGIVYVLCESKVYCLGARGEITIPSSVRHIIASHYFGNDRPTKTP